MKKSLIFVSVICAIFPISTLAEDRLSPSEYMVLQQAVQKIQQKPFHVQEAVIVALKKKIPGLTNERKKVLYSALEQELRQKIASGDVLATSIEKKEVIQALVADKGQKTGSATMQISGNITSAQEGAMSFQSTIIADIDVQNIQNPKIRFQAEVSGKNQENTIDASAEMRILDAVGYMMLKKFSFTPDDEQMSFLIKPYLNVWWSIPLDDVFSQEVESSVEQQTVQNQRIREVLLKKNLIPQLVYKGQQQSSSLYRGIIDNTALVEVIASLAQSQGETMIESDKEELHTMLQGVIVQSDFIIDTYKKLSHTVTTVSMKNKKIDDDTLNGVITIDITTSSSIHPILAPETSHDISEIGAGF